MSTYMMVGGDGREYGPVTTEQLRQWVTEGRANGQTMVRPEGAADWVTLESRPEFSDLFANAASTAAGAAGPAAPPPAAAFLTGEGALQQAAARDYQLVFGDCLSAGWAMVKANFGLLVGATVVLFVIQGVLSLIPFLGGIAGLILGGPLTGGLYWLFLRVHRGEEAEFSDVFAGFSRGFANLMLTQIVTSLLAGACVIPGAVCLAVGVFTTAAAGHHGAAFLLSQPVFIVGLVLLVPGVLAAMYLGVCWFFALPIVVDHQVGFWTGMHYSRQVVRQHWWTIFVLGIILGLVNLLGLALCCVGLLVTAPLAVATIVVVYEQLFSARTAPATSPQPPGSHV